MAHKEKWLGPDGLVWPSVTEVLNIVAKPYLYAWYAKHGWAECERVKKESAAFGQRVHDLIEKGLKGEWTLPLRLGPDGMPSNTREEILAATLLLWAQQAEFVFEQLEVHLVHPDGYHGTTDAIGHFVSLPGIRWVLDWKTSNSVDRTYGMQVGGYADAWNRMHPDQPVTHGGIVRLAKDPEAVPQMEVVSFPTPEEQAAGAKDLSSHIAAFQNAFGLVKYFKEQTKRGKSRS